MKRDLQIVKALIKEMYEGSTCKECGGSMYEGMCTECGYMEEVSYDKSGLEHPEKADLNKDKDITSYEKKRGSAIEKSMKKEYHHGHDHEVSMANNSLDSILWAANELKKYLGDEERDIPAWIQDHITNAENYILQAAKNFHEYGDHEEEQHGEEPEDMSLASLMEAKKKPVKEMIKKSGSKYVVYSKKGKKLGTHPSKKKAQKQMAAIEISKQGK